VKNDVGTYSIYRAAHGNRDIFCSPEYVFLQSTLRTAIPADVLT
jgi:hypothetical protein